MFAGECVNVLKYKFIIVYVSFYDVIYINNLLTILIGNLVIKRIEI